MEISLVASNSLKIRSKQSLIMVNNVGKGVVCQGVILFGKDMHSANLPENIPVISGPGEYEIGGIKITGIPEVQTIYSMHIDGIDVLLTTTSALEKMHSKLKEHHIIILHEDDSLSSSSVMTLSPKVLLVYGEGSEQTVKTLSKEDVKRLSKYSTALEKLPQELEVVLLAPSV